MSLAIQCIITCIIFTVIVMPPVFKNPLVQIGSYPPAIRKRVEELPQYANIIKSAEKTHIARKIIAAVVSIIILGVVAYFSGARTFLAAFYHVFILFFVVNIYDMIVLDFVVFCHSKKVIIPGTEDMIDEYKKPWHHIRGAFIGTVLGAIVALLSATLVYAYSLIF